MLINDRKNKALCGFIAANCRTSYSCMAQALKISKDAVAYRIKKLEEQKIINN